jgi:hypothetical protein
VQDPQKFDLILLFYICSYQDDIKRSISHSTKHVVLKR